ncbi:putative inactive poly [ADP-ribose] polymerase SRO2, partial [Mucuna pruriens]
MKSIENLITKGVWDLWDMPQLSWPFTRTISFSLTRRARWGSFEIFSKAVTIKCGGDANVRYAWDGGSFDDLLDIRVSCYRNSLFSANFSIDGAMSTVADEHGLRHVLPCRVILGKVEAVPAGSKQSQPSSNQYDTGVDDILAPRRHIIWTTFMNSHIH